MTEGEEHGMPHASGAAAKQIAADGLRKALLDGDMVPGQRLVEPELAERFEVSRSALRGALMDLAADGLVERIPNRGARVRVVPVEEAVAITECRMVLDGLCAAKAATLATDEQGAALTELGTAMRQAVAAGEPMKYSSLNSELHRSVREISGQYVATRLLERLHAQIVRHQFRLSLRPGRPQTSLPEHLAIIDAIVTGDPDAAEAAARTHLRSVIDALHAAAAEAGG